MDSVYRGWAGRSGKGWAVRAGGEPKVSSSIHLNGKATTVCSLKCTDSHSSLARLVRSLTTKCGLISVPQKHHTLHIVDCHEFTGLQK